MRQLLVAAAFVSLAATGCVSSYQFASNTNKGAAAHSARARSASDSEIIQTSFMQGGLMGKHKKSCDPCCGECECGCADDCCCAGDACCDAACGCPTACCDASCGCEDPCCGCQDPCCGGSGCDDRNCFQKLIDRVASGGCKNGRNTGGCNGNGCSNGECGLGHCPGGRGSGGMCHGGGNGGHSGCGPCCEACSFHECCLCPHAGGYPANVRFNPGPPTGQVAYPYYTTRGPRDFLLNNPPNIGPY